jgi:hypothetical protein
MFYFKITVYVLILSLCTYSNAKPCEDIKAEKIALIVKNEENAKGLNSKILPSALFVKNKTLLNKAKVLYRLHRFPSRLRHRDRPAIHVLSLPFAIPRLEGHAAAPPAGGHRQLARVSPRPFSRDRPRLCAPWQRPRCAGASP